MKNGMLFSYRKSHSSDAFETASLQRHGTVECAWIAGAENEENVDDIGSSKYKRIQNGGTKLSTVEEEDTYEKDMLDAQDIEDDMNFRDNTQNDTRLFSILRHKFSLMYKWWKTRLPESLFRIPTR